jgi:predicted phage terminase large subunit-like protein
LLVVTRWHVDDLAGRLLSGENEDDQVPWTVISLPALAEENDPLGRAPGEALWPERYDADTLRASRATLGSYFFEALYQQRPTKRAGGMFKRDWFQIVGAPLRGAKRVRCWDLAGTEGEGDWTAGVKLAERDGNFCFEDVVRGQWGPRGVRDRVLQTAQLDGPEVEIVLFQDPGQAGKDQVSEYRKLLVGFPVHVMSSSGNPDLRAESLSAQFEAGAVTLLRAHWNEEFIDELCAFSSKSTNGIDDQVDGASGGFVRLTIAGRFGTYFDQLDDDDPEPVEAVG